MSDSSNVMYTMKYMYDPSCQLQGERESVMGSLNPPLVHDSASSFTTTSTGQATHQADLAASSSTATVCVGQHKYNCRPGTVSRDAGRRHEGPPSESSSATRTFYSHR